MLPAGFAGFLFVNWLVLTQTFTRLLLLTTSASWFRTHFHSTHRIKNSVLDSDVREGNAHGHAFLRNSDLLRTRVALLTRGQIFVVHLKQLWRCWHRTTQHMPFVYFPILNLKETSSDIPTTDDVDFPCVRVLWCFLWQYFHAGYCHTNIKTLAAWTTLTESQNSRTGDSQEIT